MNAELSPSAQGPIKIGRLGVTHKLNGNRRIYKCGHRGMPILLNGSEHSLKLYYEWAETKGFVGTAEKCWKCFVEELWENAW